VRRVLPDWLANPSIVLADLHKDKCPVDDMKGLSQHLVQSLLKNKITHFFPGKHQ